MARLDHVSPNTLASALRESPKGVPLNSPPPPGVLAQPSGRRQVVADNVVPDRVLFDELCSGSVSDGQRLVDERFDLFLALLRPVPRPPSRADESIG
jgi:hypothetical protein